MPTYEYECRTCGHCFEVFQNMKDDPLGTCPQCGKEIRRVINGGTGVIFKGSGFYVTDKKGGGKKSAPDAAPASDTACAGCPKSDGGGCPAAKQAVG